MSKYDIIYKEKVIGRINEKLVRQQGVSDVDLEKIKQRHAVKRFYIEWLASINPHQNPHTVNSLQKAITDIEFELQELWNFKKDVRFHKFWELPHCRCPKLDNELRYPTGLYIINGACPLHGEFL